MPTTQQAPEIVDKVTVRLQKAAQEGIFLKVDGYKIDDDWLYIAVVPSTEGVRASTYANFMSQVERTLRAEGVENVLLVPAIED